MGLTLSGSTGAHDPVVIRAGDRYYLFHTGRGIPTKTSTNLTQWSGGGSVFSSNPSWIAGQVPGATDLWAPDISYFGGVYHLYYSASTFGENRSCIGHATRPALDSGSWTDQGPAICSNTGSTRDDWNAIDPNVIVDGNGTPYLSFGSFWSGIKMIQLDQAGVRVGTDLRAIANRPSAGGALEAPYIVRRCGYYYLFVSWDRCCQGVSSTYNIRVGRSTSVTGPFTDKAGMAMMSGGGTLVLQGNSTWHGPGHNAVIFSGGASYNVYHAYSGPGGTLRISDLVWDADGWPVSGGP
jgi:arabinan endo-1,5-alpha-L-arabinosidase